MSPPVFSTDDILISRYQVERYLTAGGMQEVYLCKDLALDRQVVVKTPKGGVSDRRFRRGAEMGARVNHHNVASTFDYFEDNTVTFMVEEFVEGRDLGKRLQDEFFYLDPFLAAHVVHGIAKALYEAHRVGIAHRDLKPSNVMTSADAGISIIKLTDFGIAKLAQSEIAVEMRLFDNDPDTLTTSNTLLGAVPYMAPECWVNWKDVGQEIDIWSLGCIAYQLVSGKAPFGTGRAAIFAVAQAQAAGKVQLTKPSNFGKHPATAVLEDGLWDLIQACIQLDPANRAKADEVVERCGTFCYSLSERSRGTITDFGSKYENGKVKPYGFLSADGLDQTWFFHKDEFYGDVQPAIGQRVSCSLYPGQPRDRAAPVLLLR